MGEVDRQRLIPELEKFASELDRRFAVPLKLEDKRIASLSPFHRAALLLYCSHLQEIDKLTRDLFETVADIRNFTRATVDPTNVAVPLLNESTLAKQSANVDMVSGATWTSDSYTTSLQAALDKAAQAA